MMAAIYQLGYRLAMLCAGAGALYIADFVSWRAAYLAMAGLTVVGIGGCLLSPRLDDKARAASAPLGAFGEPLADLVRRYGATLVVILALVAIYRLPDFVSGVMANPLYIDLGFSKTDIATVSKLYGVWIGMAGAFGGGIAVARLGIMPSLLIGGFAASASHLTLAYLAASGAQLPLLTLSVSVESFASGFAGAALIAYMSSLVSPAFAATQYALLSSLYALPGKFVGGLSGVMVDAFGYVRILHRHRDDRHTGGGADADRLAAGEAREGRTARLKSSRPSPSSIPQAPNVAPRRKRGFGGQTDQAARRLRSTSRPCNVGSSCSEEPEVEILQHGEAHLWNEPVPRRLRRLPGNEAKPRALSSLDRTCARPDRQRVRSTHVRGHALLGRRPS